MKRWTLGVLALCALGLALRLATLPPAPDLDDSFLFVAGVIRYSIAETRPHWPGYPVYIWIGKLANALVRDPVLALHVVSVVASSLVAWPLGAIARRWAIGTGVAEARANLAGWAAAALWLATPMSWVTGSQIASDPLGLLAGLTMLLVSIHAERTGGPWAWAGAATLGGLMIGVRLVNVTMLGPLAWAAWHYRRETWFGRRAAVVLLLAVLAGVIPWLGWMALREGEHVVRGGAAHVTGHFTRWGESVLTDPQLPRRPLRALRTIVVYGLGGGTPALGWGRVVTCLVWLALLVASARRVVRASGRLPVPLLVILWGAPNVAYTLLAHDVALPRYMMSEVALLSLVGGLAALDRAGAALAALAVAASAAASVPVAAVQHRQPLAEYAAARFLTARPRSAVAVVEAPTLPFYLGRAAENVEWTMANVEDVPRLRAQWEKEGRPVFTTEPPPDDPTGWRPVAHFCRDALVDPRLGHDLWLFAPASASPEGLVDDCGG